VTKTVPTTHTRKLRFCCAVVSQVQHWTSFLMGWYL